MNSGTREFPQCLGPQRTALDRGSVRHEQRTAEHGGAGAASAVVLARLWQDPDSFALPATRRAPGPIRALSAELSNVVAIGGIEPAMGAEATQP